MADQFPCIGMLGGTDAYAFMAEEDSKLVMQDACRKYRKIISFNQSMKLILMK